ncbi:outer membrane protein [Bradyrhizobium sp. McL0615]|uniref:outer membrane protein n=1 Tax=Bradyrhizobium sp. McL0615 TaxID=3415673 RepID=UPI003CEBE041
MNTRVKYLAAALLLATPLSANAADLAVKAPPAPMPAAVYNWTGLYVGVNGGWGWGRQDPLNLIADRFDRASFDINGGMIGGTFGAQIQQGYIVLGLETDLDWANIKGSRVTLPTILGVPQPFTLDVNSKIEALGTARARAGVAMNNWLIYATGGAAFAKQTASATTIAGIPCGTFGVLPGCAESHWRPGLAVGGGAEWGFAPSWSAKVEYLYVAAMGTGASTDHFNVVRGGINYRFGGF